MREEERPGYHSLSLSLLFHSQSASELLPVYLISLPHSFVLLLAYSLFLTSCDHSLCITIKLLFMTRIALVLTQNLPSRDVIIISRQ